MNFAVVWGDVVIAILLYISGRSTSGIIAYHGLVLCLCNILKAL